MSLPPNQVNGLNETDRRTLPDNGGSSHSATVVSTSTAQIVETSISNDDVPGQASITEYSSSAMEVDGPTTEVTQIQQTTTTSHVFVDNTFQRASSLPVSLAPKYRFGYVYDDMMLMHAPQTEHPEMPARIHQIFSKLQHGGVIKYMKRVPIRDAKKFEVLLVHSEDHWDKVDAIKCKFRSDL